MFIQKKCNEYDILIFLHAASQKYGVVCSIGEDLGK